MPDGWSTANDGFMVKSGADVVGMSVWDVAQVPGHPCHWKRTMSPVGPTVDDLVDALSSQRLRDPTEPSDITLAGHHGRYLELSVPSDCERPTQSDHQPSRWRIDDAKDGEVRRKR